MFKKIILGLAVSTVILSASSDTITFKLEGKLGEEIKALIEKYKGSLETVTINKSTSNINVDQMMAQVEAKIEAKQAKTVENKKQEAIQETTEDGKIIFVTKCQTCHGNKAEKEAYNVSRPLNTLSLDEIKASLKGYQNGNKSNGLSAVMVPYANQLMQKDIEAIYNYIQTMK